MEKTVTVILFYKIIPKIWIADFKGIIQFLEEFC